MALLDGHCDRAAQLPLEPGEVIDHCVANRPGPIVELDRGSLHGAAMREPAPPRPLDPIVEEGMQAGQPARRLKRRQKNGLGKARCRRLEGGDLQFLSRAKMGEEPALGQMRALGQRADGNRLEATFACLLKRRRKNDGTCLLALAHVHNNTNDRAFCQARDDSTNSSNSYARKPCPITTPAASLLRIAAEGERRRFSGRFRRRVWSWPFWRQERTRSHPRSGRDTYRRKRSPEGTSLPRPWDAPRAGRGRPRRTARRCRWGSAQVLWRARLWRRERVRAARLGSRPAPGSRHPWGPPPPLFHRSPARPVHRPSSR